MLFLTNRRYRKWLLVACRITSKNCSDFLWTKQNTTECFVHVFHCVAGNSYHHFSRIQSYRTQIALWIWFMVKTIHSVYHWCGFAKQQIRNIYNKMKIVLLVAISLLTVNCDSNSDNDIHFGDTSGSDIYRIEFVKSWIPLFRRCSHFTWPTDVVSLDQAIDISHIQIWILQIDNSFIASENHRSYRLEYHHCAASNISIDW